MIPTNNWTGKKGSNILKYYFSFFCSFHIFDESLTKQKINVSTFTLSSYCNKPFSKIKFEKTIKLYIKTAGVHHKLVTIGHEV